MHKFVRNLLTEWRRLELPVAGETIIAAVSGGADSVSLALALSDLKARKKLDLRFIIAHFNHNIRGIESEKDAKFVKYLAENLDFEFFYRIQNPKSKIQNQKGNLEQNARQARYGFLTRVAQQYNASAILTAHTQNDQAETILLNLIRGSGLEGLAGMKAVRDIEPTSGKHLEPDASQIQNPKPKIVRPLLNWAGREETEMFCRENKIDFREDRMNADLRFSRVRVRREIIPLLQKLNPRLIETLSRTARILGEDAEQLIALSRKLSGEFSQKDFKSLSKSMRWRVLREWLREQRGHLRQIDLKHLEALERLILSRKSGRIVELPGGQQVIKQAGKIVFEKSRVEKS
jgi:tRNA(Ile)-lysidine synthase